MREAALEGHFRRKVKEAGGASYKMAPTTAGIPDRLVLWPGGVIHLVELKTETGAIRPIQTLWHERALELGTYVFILRGKADVDLYAEWGAYAGDEIYSPFRRGQQP